MLGQRSDWSSQILNRTRISEGRITFSSINPRGYSADPWSLAPTVTWLSDINLLLRHWLLILGRDSCQSNRGHRGRVNRVMNFTGTVQFKKGYKLYAVEWNERNTLKDLLQWIKIFSNEFPSAHHRSAWISLSPVEDWDASEGAAPSSEQRYGGFTPLTCCQSAVWRTTPPNPYILAVSSSLAPPCLCQTPLLCFAGGSSQRCLPFMGWSLEVVAKVIQQLFFSVSAGGGGGDTDIQHLRRNKAEDGFNQPSPH